MRRLGPWALALLLVRLLPAEAQAPDRAGLPPARGVTERGDYSLYLDGSYVGHVYREARGRISALSADPASRGSYLFEARFYLLEQTLRDMRGAARGVDRSAESRFSASAASLPGLASSFLADSGYPSLRGLPSLPAGELEAGASWTAPGERSLELEGLPAPILLPFLAEYRYAGKVEYRGLPAIKLLAKFATRYRARPAAGQGGAALVEASGSHDLEITIGAEDLAPLFIRDRFDESFTLSSGRRERRSGFNLVFYEDSPPLDRNGTLLALSGRAGGGAASPAARPPSPVPAQGGPVQGAPAAPAGPVSSAGPPPAAASAGGGSVSGAGPGELDPGSAASPLDEGGALAGAGVELAPSPAGVLLRVRELRFVADSDAILGSELWRLDAIAAALAAVPGRRILVEGHSASVGKAAGELELSGKRAAKVAEALAARGIEPSRLMYRGLGSSQPIADNATEEGRARNRRVEITILE